MIYLLVILLGGFVGGISAFLGLGGGVVIVPMLPELTPLNSHQAIATSLTTIFLVVCNNTLSFHRQGLVVWPVALVVGPLTAFGAFASGICAQWISGEILRWILTAVVFTVLFRAVLRLVKRNVVDLATESLSLKQLPAMKKSLIGGVGIFAGLLSGVSGIGAGLVVSPLLIQLSLVRNEKVSPTANAVMVFTTFFGALAFARPELPVGFEWGYIRLDLALLLAVSAYFSSYFARKYQSRMPIGWRLGLLTGLLFLLFLKMVFEVSASFL